MAIWRNGFVWFLSWFTSYGDCLSLFRLFWWCWQLWYMRRCFSLSDMCQWIRCCGRRRVCRYVTNYVYMKAWKYVYISTYVYIYIYLWIVYMIIYVLFYIDLYVENWYVSIYCWYYHCNENRYSYFVPACYLANCYDNFQITIKSTKCKIPV